MSGGHHRLRSPAAQREISVSREVTPNFKQIAKKKPSAASQHAAWSKKVRQRDGYRCQYPACGMYRRENHAHHVANKKQRPDLKYDVDNGVCLCREHHDWAHAHPIEAAELDLVSHERYEKARNARPSN